MKTITIEIPDDVYEEVRKDLGDATEDILKAILFTADMKDVDSDKFVKWYKKEQLKNMLAVVNNDTI